jgi:acyl-coenzyme A synthetase/AMP-(fatty) acid ligase
VLTGEIVRLNAEKYPTKVALLRDSPEITESRTWAELNANVNSLANALLSLGVQHGDCVSLMSKNRVECYEAFFACAKIGAIYSPINYRFAPAEIRFVLNDSGASLTRTTSAGSVTRAGRLGAPRE